MPNVSSEHSFKIIRGELILLVCFKVACPLNQERKWIRLTIKLRNLQTNPHD